MNNKTLQPVVPTLAAASLCSSHGCCPPCGRFLACPLSLYICPGGAGGPPGPNGVAEGFQRLRIRLVRALRRPQGRGGERGEAVALLPVRGDACGRGHQTGYTIAPSPGFLAAAVFVLRAVRLFFLLPRSFVAKTIFYYVVYNVF